MLALIVKGIILADQQKYNEAISLFDKALAINPNNNHALASKGDALNALGKYDEASKYHDKALALQ